MSWSMSTGMNRGLLGLTAPYGSVAELLAAGTIWIYNGSRPADADTATTDTVLLKITLDGLAFVTGVTTNGLNLALTGLVLKQASGETWKGEGLADDTAAWARWYANDADPTTGASTTDVRMDGIVSTSGADVNMANGTAVATGVDSEVTDVSFTMGTA